MTRSVKLVKPDTFNPSSAVLVDGQTVLATTPQYFTCRKSERQAANYQHSELMPLYNFIQNLVIYDQVLVDSQLLVVEYGCEDVCALFQGAISGLLIKGGLRAAIADVVTEHVKSEELPNAEVDEPTKRLRTEMARNDSELRQFVQLSGGWFSGEVKLELTSQASLLGESFDEFLPRMTMFTGTNDRSLERAHFYLELSRALGVYLSPHPVRAEYFKRIINETMAVPRGFAANVVEYVDKKMHASEATYFMNAHWEIPPIADYILKIADDKDIDLLSAVLECRESKHARDFRRWCAEMGGAIREGRQGLAMAQKAHAELERECGAWQRDVNEYVKYKRRTLDLGDFWLFGKILKFFGMEKLPIKDPLITPDKPYLLLLNDLYTKKNLVQALR